MNYSQIYFGTDRENLTWQIVEDFFKTEKTENDTLEFKSFSSASKLDSLYDGLCKSLAAFLNSEGGILIWGAPVGTKITGKKEKIFSGALAPISEILEKDTVIRIASSRISPMPSKINLKIIEKGSVCICIFEIQKSRWAHQIGGTYYMRIDGQSVPAPHHYVEALMRQIHYPELSGHIKPGRYQNVGGNYVLSFGVVIFNFSPLQNEKKVSYRIMTSCGRFKGWDVQQIAHNYDHSGKVYYNREIIEVLHYGMPATETLSIIISGSDLAKTNSKLELFLQFGGEASPLQESRYVFNLRPLQTSETAIDLVESYSENLLLSEMQTKNGKTREEIINEALGRKNA